MLALVLLLPLAKEQMEADYKPWILLRLITTFGSSNFRTKPDLFHNFHSETTSLYKKFSFKSRLRNTPFSVG